MAYDGTRGRVVLFYEGAARELSDVWEWDGTSWEQRSLGASPPANTQPAAVYDGARRRLVLVRGEDQEPFETWEWDGDTWAQRMPTNAPPARRETALAYDSARERVVLFSGIGAQNDVADTWEWDGTTWEERLVGVAPPPRFASAMAYDSARGRVVLHGGRGAFGNLGRATDTWEWDGESWTERTPLTVPPISLWPYVMAYDAAHSRVTLFNGEGTWLFYP